MEVARALFHLKKREFITPHFIRITLSGAPEDVSKLEACTIGVNNKIFIPPSGVDTVYFPEFDEEKKEWLEQDPSVKPLVRTYTHRGIDVINNEIIIDFVNHGETGPASSWALNAAVGDPLGVAMKLGSSALYPEVDWYFLIGDATAIPVLGAIMESLPKDKQGTCILEVPTEADIQKLEMPENFNIEWIVNPHPEKGSNLADVARQVNIPDSTRFAYVAAEFSSVKELRTYFRKELQWTKEELYAYSYWKAGVAEDKSVTDRQQEKNAV